MNIIVCMKQVPDTATRIKVRPETGDIDPEGIQYVVNPYDEFAVEEALQIKERLGSGEVTVISLGTHRVKEALRSCLAMGADRGIHLNDSAFEGGDSLATAMALAAAIQRRPFDLILCGRQAVDDDQAQVGASLAELLDIPHVSLISKLELSADGKQATVRRDVEGASEFVEVDLPAVLTCQKGLNEPRYPSLKGIMAAKKKPVEELRATDLQLDANTIGAAGSKMKVLRYSAPPARGGGKILQGEPAEAVRELVRLLREEAKII